MEPRPTGIIITNTSGNAFDHMPVNFASANEGNYLLPSNPVLFSKASDDLALTVSPILRQKIIPGENVDLANLLINSQAAQSEGKQLVL